MTFNDGQEYDPLSDDEALLAEAYDECVGQGLPAPIDFESQHSELASVFRLLHITLGRQNDSAKPTPDTDNSDIPILPTRFRVIEVLGKGGFGTVLRAHDDLLKRDVAIKIVLCRRVGDPAQELSEPRAVARLSHPNIIPLYEVLNVGEKLCLISEFCSGPTLHKWLSAEGRIEIRNQSGTLVAECANSLDPLNPQGNSVDVTALALSPDGRNLLSGTIEGEIRIWRSTDLRFLGVLRARDGCGAITNLDFSKDGRRLLMHQALQQDSHECGTMIINLL